MTARRWPGGRRYLVARRVIQLGVLLAFYGTAHWAWSVAGRPLLAGNLSASSILDAVPLADPFALLQMLVSGHLPMREVLLGAALALGIYTVLGGRSFCAWVCPVNLIADAAESLRSRLGLRTALHLPRQTRYGVLVMTLVLSAILGVAAFEWVSPIGIAHRELIYGIGFGVAALGGLFVFDTLVLRHGWCGHLCPLGAFWAGVGRAARIRVAFDDASCTRCGDCLKVCPEPQVLNFNAAAKSGMVRSGECTHCARCISVCPEGSLAFRWRARISADTAQGAGPGELEPISNERSPAP